MAFVVAWSGSGPPAASAQARSRHPATLPQRTAEGLRALGQTLGHPPQQVVRRSVGPGSLQARLTYVGGFSLPMPGATDDQRARTFLSAHGALLGLQPDDTFVLRSAQHSTTATVLRYRVHLQGLPVLGRTVAVQLKSGAVVGVSGGLPPLRQVDSPTPRLSPATVEARVRRRTGVGVHRVLDLGYLVHGGDALLVWRAVQYRGEQAQRWVLLVDAHDGTLLHAALGQRAARGNVYDPNPEVAGGVSTVDLPDLTSGDQLRGTYATAYQCGGPHGDGEGVPPCAQHTPGAAPDAAGDYLLPPVEPSLSDGFAAVQAYYHVSRFNRWLAQRFGFEWRCGQRRSIDVFVNWSYASAFYGDGDGDDCPDITLGEHQVDFAYDADVIYHELGHGLVHQTAALGCPSTGVCVDSLGLNRMPDGLAEGFSDYFAMSYTASPVLGEHVGQLVGGFIRTAINDARCPWDLMGEPHHDGQVLMGGAWELRTALGADRADELLHAALITLSEDAGYGELSAALQQAAAALHGAGQLDDAGLAAVQTMVGPDGRSMTGCNRIVPLDHRPADRPVQQLYASPTLPGTLEELPAPLQLSLDAPGNALSLSIHVSPQEGHTSSWRLLLRRDQPVAVQVGSDKVTTTEDHTFGGSPRSVVLSATSTPALVPGSVYYAALVYSAPAAEVFGVTGEVTVDPSLPADAGLTPEGPNPAQQDWTGCGCRATDVPDSGLGLLLLLALLLRWARRRLLA